MKLSTMKPSSKAHFRIPAKTYGKWSVNGSHKAGGTNTFSVFDPTSKTDVHLDVENVGKCLKGTRADV